MRYSNISSRAGLVVLVVALFFSLVSAVPIPATDSGLSSALSHRINPSLDGQDLIQFDAAEISLSGRMSTLPAAIRALSRRDISTDTDDQLVRRTSIFTKIKQAFQKAGRAIKKGFQKFGGMVKKGFQKAGSAIKKGFQKVKQGFQKFGGMVKKGFQKAGSAIKKGFQKAGGAIKKGFQKFGGMVKKGFQKAGGAIKKGFQKVKQGFQTAGRVMKKGFQKAGTVLKKGFQKVGKWIKTTGAKIAKFGLKVVESVGEVVGKVVGFIPGIGKPIDRAIEGVSKAAGILSDHIHVKLSPKLQKGMDVMNKADQIMGYIPRRRELSEEEAFQERDIGEAYYFEERDDIALENREEAYFEADEQDFGTESETLITIIID